jgi:hypothetical protein
MIKQSKVLVLTESLSEELKYVACKHTPTGMFNINKIRDSYHHYICNCSSRDYCEQTLQTYFCHLLTIFHTLNCSGSLVISIKLKAKRTSDSVASVLLLYIKCTLTEDILLCSIPGTKIKRRSHVLSLRAHRVVFTD